MKRILIFKKYPNDAYNLSKEKDNYTKPFQYMFVE